MLFLSRRDASIWLTERGLTTSYKTLEHWAYQGTGPKFRRLKRRVFYSVASLEEWMNANMTDELSASWEVV